MPIKRILTIAIDETTDVPENQIAELIHRLIPGSHTLSNDELMEDFTDFEWDDNGLPMLPLDADDAEMLTDEKGYLTIVTTVDQDEFMNQRAYGRTTIGADDEHDFVHNTVFSFGLPHDATTQILAVSGNDFVVSYTTNISAIL